MELVRTIARRVEARGGSGVGGGRRGGRTIPILRWEEKRPRMGRSAGAASFFALGGIGVGGEAASCGEESEERARVFGGKWLLRRAWGTGTEGYESMVYHL
jgi:hypothetical protein